jgi:CRP-like cAMP-binding protein
MHSILQFLSPYDRIRLLQSVPFFESLEAEDLAALAEHAEEEHTRRGFALLQLGQPADAVRVLVEGEAQMRRHGSVVRRIGPGSPIGFITILAADGGTEIVTMSRTTTLMIRRSIWFDLLEDRFSILQHLIRATARQLRQESSENGQLPDAASGDRRAVCSLDDVFDRFLVLRDQLPFGKRDHFGLWHLARRTSPISYGAGETLFREGQASSELILLTAGSVEADGSIFDPGSALGIVDTLAEEPRSYTAVAQAACSGVRIDREELLDMFEDHFDIALDCLATISLSVLDAMERRAARSKEVPSGFNRFS